ncbi:MAG: hypothetical protein ACRC57_10540 [Sarcina sp.]
MVEILKLIEMVLMLTVGSIGIYLIFGFIYAAIERGTSRNLIRRFGEKAIVTTGFIGTTLHELSHLLMALLFGHKIVSVKLFSLNLQSRTLGHVKHSYNKRNYYQRIGNFFIGIAPIIGGTIIILILLRVFLPSSWNNIINHFNLNEYVTATEQLNIRQLISYMGNDFIVIIKSIFAVSNLTTIRFWVFMFLLISITNHMSLSPADFKNSLDGLIFIVILSFIIAIILELFNVNISSIIHALVIYNVFVFSILLLVLILAILIWAVTKLLSII